MTDHEWHLHLWECLASEARRTVRELQTRVTGYEAEPTLAAFAAYCEETANILREAYDLADSDAF